MPKGNGHMGGDNTYPVVLSFKIYHGFDFDKCFVLNTLELFRKGLCKSR